MKHGRKHALVRDLAVDVPMVVGGALGDGGVGNLQVLTEIVVMVQQKWANRGMGLKKE